MKTERVKIVFEYIVRYEDKKDRDRLINDVCESGTLGICGGSYSIERVETKKRGRKKGKVLNAS